MPEVRRYGGRKVTTDPLQGGRRTAAETPLSTGAGLAEAEGRRAEAFAGVGTQVAQFGIRAQAGIWEEERRRADEVAAMDVDTRLSQWANKRMYDPESGALNVRGHDALPLPEQVMGEFTEVAGEIERGLTSERQRAAFQRIKAQHSEQLDVQLRRHVFTEMRAYDAGVVQATVETAVESAIANAQDPRRVGTELTKAVTALKGAAKTQGWSPEMVAKKVADVQSATHEGVINNLLATPGQERAAKVYYEEAAEAGQLSGDAVTRVKKALEVGTLRAESQQKAEEIRASGKSPAEQIEMARAIDDPELQDATLQRVRQDIEIGRARAREQHEGMMLDATNVIERTGKFDAIPPAMIANMSREERSGLREYAKAKQTGGRGDVETDLEVYYELKQEALEHPDAFAKYSLVGELGRLGKTEFKELTELQMKIRKGDPDANKILDGVRTDTQKFKETMTEAGIDPDSKQAARLHRLWEQRVDDAQRDGKPLTGTEKQQMLDDIWQTVVLKPGGWANIFPGGEPFYPVTKTIRDLSIEDIPSADRRAVEQKLRDKKRPVNEDSILTTYIAWKRELGEIK